MNEFTFFFKLAAAEVADFAKGMLKVPLFCVPGEAVDLPEERVKGAAGFLGLVVAGRVPGRVPGVGVRAPEELGAALGGEGPEERLVGLPDARGPVVSGAVL
jgi:hypothetical protein